MDKRTVFRGISNYLLSVGLALVFALYLSGRIGWFFIAAFICAPLISVLLTLLFVNRIYLSAECDSATVSKGDEARVRITLSNGMFLPSPPVSLQLCSSGGAVSSDPRLTCWLMPLSDESVNAVYSARICGPHVVGAESVTVSDYFGIFTFRIKSADVKELQLPLNIIPDIADVPFTDRVFKRASEISAASDDSEDTISTPLHMFGGFPGYDSREYAPGDPLKRINWKQSARKGTLLVRLDDETPAQSIAVVLDGVFEENTDPMLFHSSDKLMGGSVEELKELAKQWAVENSLGMVRAFVRRNYSVTYIYMGEHGWQSTGINDESEITPVQTDLASLVFKPSTGVQRFPEDELNSLKGSVCIYYTPYATAKLHELVTSMGSDVKGGMSTLICAAVTEVKEG
ncbi:MAG: DUF58 domain-containing protein [Oscillospiraceae bacterium]|nr:DUF58 domain-containing protein [Oscillospiraceae bacterium]